MSASDISIAQKHDFSYTLSNTHSGWETNLSTRGASQEQVGLSQTASQNFTASSTETGTYRGWDSATGAYSAWTGTDPGPPPR